MKQISLDALNNQLFETIEMLKNNSDEKASPNEKIEVEIAKEIANLGKVIVESYKIKAQVLNIMSRATDFDPSEIRKMLGSSGMDISNE